MQKYFIDHTGRCLLSRQRLKNFRLAYCHSRGSVPTPREDWISRRAIPANHFSFFYSGSRQDSK
jgi:hypothetical protein